MLRKSFLFAIVLALMTTGIASAHADLVQSDPATNSTLDAAPKKITLEFSETIEPAFSKITVIYEDGSNVDAGDSAVSAIDAKQLTVSLNDSRHGTYVVSWRVLSAVDGHITSGAFVFSVGQPINQATISREAAAQGEGAVTSPIDMLARALTFIGQALIIGLVAFRWLIWRPALKSAQIGDAIDDQAIRCDVRLVVVAMGVATAGLVLTLIGQSALSNATIPAWLSTRVGRVWIGRAATLIALAIMADDVAASGRRKFLPSIAVIWLSAQLLFLTTLTSHSAAVADPPIIPFAADFIHLISTSIWIGGLAQMAFVMPAVAKTLDDEDRAWLWLDTVVHFSTVAAIGVGLIVITGVYMSFLNVGDWPALITTVYGQALLLKIALAGIALLIGAYNLIVVKPKLDHAIDAPETAPRLHRRFRRTVTLEAITGLLVLAAAGILTDLPRSKDPQPAVASGPLQLTARADNLDFALTIDPARSGASNFRVRVSDQGRAVTDAKDVSFRFTYLTRGIGTTKATAPATQDGAYAASGAYLSLPGEWQIEIAVQRPTAFDAFAAYRVKVGLDGLIMAAGVESVIDSLVRWLSIYGLLFGGIITIGMSAIWLFIGLKAARNTVSLAILLIPSVIALPIGVYSVVMFTREATPGLTLTNPFLPDEPSLAAGQKLFEANCAACHGDQGRGNGPAAANLSGPPPDFGNGHLDIHTDGDIFYWIQNGFGGSSPMPVFKGKLSDDDIWNLVNYVRRLRNLATGKPLANVPQPIATPAPIPTPAETPTRPPGATNTLTITSTSDAEALKLLARADAAMNALTSLVEDQSLRDDAGNQLIVRFDYAAPDRLRYQVVNGPTAIEIGEDDYQRGPDGTWIKNQRAVSLRWPNFAYSQTASHARLDGTEQWAGKRVTIVAFRYGSADFRVWLDPDTSYILKYTMEAPQHHMQSTYSAFNAAPPIEAPAQ